MNLGTQHSRGGSGLNERVQTAPRKMVASSWPHEMLAILRPRKMVVNSWSRKTVANLLPHKMLTNS